MEKELPKSNSPTALDLQLVKEMQQHLNLCMKLSLELSAGVRNLTPTEQAFIVATSRIGMQLMLKQYSREVPNGRENKSGSTESC